MYDYENHIKVLQTEVDLITANLANNLYSEEAHRIAVQNVRVFLEARIQRIRNEAL